MGWDGSGNVNRSDGTYSGATVWVQNRDNGVNVNATPHDAHDEDLATAIENCVARDGQNTPSANLPMATFKHTNVGAASARTDYARASQVQDASLIYFVSGGAANVQTGTLAPAITAYVDGMLVVMKAGFTNTAASPTLNLNSVGAKKISGPSGGAIPVGFIRSGSIYVLEYNSAFDSAAGAFAVVSNGPNGFLSHTPTIAGDGGLTVTGGTVNYSAFQFVAPNLVKYDFNVSGTFATTETNIATLTLPFAAAARGYPQMGMIRYEQSAMGGDGIGAAYVASGSASLKLTKYESSSANWILAPFTIYGTITYEV